MELVRNWRQEEGEKLRAAVQLNRWFRSRMTSARKSVASLVFVNPNNVGIDLITNGIGWKLEAGGGGETEGGCAAKPAVSIQDDIGA